MKPIYILHNKRKESYNKIIGTSYIIDTIVILFTINTSNTFFTSHTIDTSLLFFLLWRIRRYEVVVIPKVCIVCMVPGRFIDGSVKSRCLLDDFNRKTFVINNSQNLKGGRNYMSGF